MTEDLNQETRIPSHEEFLQELLASPSEKTADYLVAIITHFLSREDGYAIVAPVFEQIAKDPNNLYLTKSDLRHLAVHGHNKEAFISIGRIMLRRSDCTIDDIKLLYKRSIAYRLRNFEIELLDLILQHPRLGPFSLAMIRHVYNDRYDEDVRHRIQECGQVLQESRMYKIAGTLLPNLNF